MGIEEHRLIALRIAAALHFVFGLCDEVKKEIALPEAGRAADMIRGMTATWNMAPLESSILAAACAHVRANCGLDHTIKDYRYGVLEALHNVGELITPIDYVR
jgi:hypothetical protein